MNKIIQVAQDAKQIIKSSADIKCTLCGEKQFSVFDKLWVAAYDICYMCTDVGPDEEQVMADNIFKIVEEIL